MSGRFIPSLWPFGLWTTFAPVQYRYLRLDSESCWQERHLKLSLFKSNSFRAERSKCLANFKHLAATHSRLDLTAN